MTSLIYTLASYFALATVFVLLILVLFEPGLRYKVNTELPPPDSDKFLPLLSAVVDQPALEMRGFDVMRDGRSFYAAELDAIAMAKTSIQLEAFIFHVSPVAERFIRALAERARAGVKVRVTVDAWGSMLTPDRFFEPLRQAGGEVVWYQPLRWYTLKRYNNRTHRELLVVDGRIAFIGGAGIGPAWDTGMHGRPPWRDTMVRVEGPAAAALQTVFIENWLESSGEILADEAVFPVGNRFERPTVSGERLSMVVGSTPSAARGTRARILFQLLIAAARKTIHINSPYFLPDRALRRELLAAAARGVQVRIIVPGRYNNHLLARYTSRRYYGELIGAGIEIHEYQPGMIHAKIMVVDFLWSVVGSTNFDSRSFELNDEVNLAAMDPRLATRLHEDFQRDLQLSRKVEFHEWARRPLHERLIASVGMVLERQE